MARWLGGLLMGMAILLSASAWAAESPWVEGDHGRLRLVSMSDGLNGANTTLGLHFQLKDDWKIYWRNPGDAGFPPKLSTEGSTNLEGLEILWPVPQRFTVLGLESFGYKHEVVLPLAATVTNPDQPLNLSTHLEYLACAEICVPAKADLRMTLAPGAGGPSDVAHLINQFLSRVPPVQTGDAPAPTGLAIGGAKLLPDQKLSVTVAANSPLRAPDLLVEGPEGMQFGKPEVTGTDDGGHMTLVVSVNDQYATKKLGDGDRLVVTLIDGQRGVEREVSLGETGGTLVTGQEPMARPDTAREAPDGPGLATMLAFALLGGLILNLMPCVLPVLSLKLLHVVRAGGEDRPRIRQGFLATAAGILFSFMMMAVALAGLKASGTYVGWGIQFQQPVFLVAMVLVMTLFMASMWGWLHIHLPASIAHLGEKTFHIRGLSGHFLTGLFATLLATPCSAPFLGTAVGFALSRGSGEILLIFLVLGLGLSIPYLAVAAFPALVAWLPKPGRWMIWLQRGLGLVLAGFIVWLVADVLDAQIGATAAATIGLMLILLLAVLGLGRRLAPPVKGAGLAVLAVLAFSTPAVLGAAPTTDQVAEDDGPWVAFDRQRIDRLVAEGKTVFVDVTAEWCITCKVNKQTAFGSPDVRERLLDKDMVAMKADWTRPDPRINAFLDEFGRSGIPFNVAFGPAAPQGVTLPELLTPGLVLQAMSAARGTPTQRAAQID